MKNHREDSYTAFKNETFFIRSVGYCEQSRDVREKIRKIEFSEFFWCTAGTGIFKLGRRRYILHPGEIFFLPSGSVMDFHPGSGGWSHYYLTFEGNIVPEFFSVLGLTPGKKFCGKAPDDLFHHLISELKHPAPEKRIELLGIAMQIIFQIATAGKIQQKEKDSLAKKVRTMIEENYSDPDFNIGKMAYHFAVHRVTLCREFKKVFGITPQKFLVSYRLHKALELLQQKQLTIKEIAFTCGFSTQEYFSTAFSAKFGYPPSRL
ncbi:MAG: AraC family transcriptional regulator [Lentisphaeria bacterium]|nr:AraC family transcriptional regulator [Lentisphaeria bacterium]